MRRILVLLSTMTIAVLAISGAMLLLSRLATSTFV